MTKADRLKLIRESVEAHKPRRTPSLREMRAGKIGYPDPEDCLPIVFVLRGEVVGKADDVFDALEHIDEYPVGTEIFGAEAWERMPEDAKALGFRVKQDYLPVAHIVPPQKLGA